MRRQAKKTKAKRPQRPYVGDTARQPHSARQKADVSFGMIVFAAAVGFVVGLMVLALFRLSTWLTELVWGSGMSVATAAFGGTPLGSWWLPIAFCAVGGLVIGLFTKYVGGQPEELQQVLGTVKKTGGYTLEKPAASAIGFLLPLMFGGSIGPEAGLTGLIAAGCTKIGAWLRGAGLRVVAVSDVTIAAALSAIFATPFAGIVAASGEDLTEEGGERPLDPLAYDFRRGAKIALYVAAAFGAAAGGGLLTMLFGAQAGMPRFEGIEPQLAELWWCIPCVVLGYLGALLFHAGEFGFGRAARALGDRPVLKPVIAGVVLGVVAIPLGYVLFPGEEQAFELMESWQTIGAAVLIITGFAKCLATPLCLRFGWKGGHFFPLIFAGIAIGYGLASISGVDPMFCVAITTGTLVAGVQRKPLMAMALLLLCFPAKSILWMGLACLLGAFAPMPQFLFAKGRAAKDDQ